MIDINQVNNNKEVHNTLLLAVLNFCKKKVTDLINAHAL